ncbi:GDSL esterase/lipase [Quillaja saponaria]|uniref:GDSL esterase/lipase n=1 Tax=Quillaja saponaria TaxID=32244 RepID=A0AAD7L692_QUISA|nr:GDSL esterase/lipase [Quillaja saponaria]
MASLRFRICFFVFCITQCHGNICLPKNHTALFIFGDSLFDAGNNNYINTTTDNEANYSPYGETFFKYPSGRFSDGHMVPDFIAEYAKLPLIQPYLHPGYHQYIDGVNFASAGAGALVQTHQGWVIDLETQLRYFKKVEKILKHRLGDAEAKTLLSKAVYLFSIGTNDYIELYKKGERKFGFLNLAPVGCLSGMRLLAKGGTGACLEEASAIAKLHNSALPKVLKKLENRLKGFKYSVANFYDSLTEMMVFPSKYGFKERKAACCGSGPYRGYSSCGGKRGLREYELCGNVTEHVFFDSHPTERASQYIAQLMWSGNPHVMGPYNLKELFAM